MTEQEKYMKEAIRQAKKALALDEVPIGCVIVRDGKIIARAHNECESRRDATAHAELQAIRRACRAVNDWRLTGCTLYVTLEPCPMCAGAVVQARVGRLVYGAPNPAQGCAGSLYRVTEDPAFPHFCPADGGVLAGECEALLRAFFDETRRSH